MNAKDLRIGNFVDRNGLMEVIEIQKAGRVWFYDHVNKMETKSFWLDEWTKPILLTKKWLSKFGVKMTLLHSGIYYYDFNSDNMQYRLYYTDTTKAFELHCKPTLDNFYPLIMPISYVHEYQNLYFALTGEELQLSK